MFGGIGCVVSPIPKDMISLPSGFAALYSLDLLPISGKRYPAPSLAKLGFL